MNSGRQNPINDDYGDRFPGALTAPDTAEAVRADERVVRMHAAYARKADALVAAGREDLAHELSEAFVEESAATHAEGAPETHVRRVAGRRTPTRGKSGRRPAADSRLARVRRATRSSLDRFDRYTLDVFNAGSPYRSDRSL